MPVWLAPLLPKILAGVAALGLLGGVYWYVHHQGYVAGQRDAQNVCASEKAAMDKANKDAIAKAGKKLADATVELANKSQEINDAINTLDAAAAANPNGRKLCLSGDSVRRLQALH